ncbi:pre-16S rRNA-processing nuclease YqgF [candidate division WWE3 bacterium]|nr:pre-16S rRNA-processing nuclease YqgF [candidate division WWE3 bacterium]
MTVKHKNEQVIIGVDLGLRYIGLAIYRPAYGIESLSSHQYKNEFLFFEYLSNIVKEFDVTAFLVGDMGEKKLPDNFQKVFTKIKKQFGVDIILFSEFLTTFQAEKNMRHDGLSLSHNLGHSESAKELLRDYLSNQAKYNA